MTTAESHVAAVARPPLPSDLIRAGKLRIKIRDGNVVIKRAETPEWTASRTLIIPEKYRDQPMEGIVLAVGRGRPMEERYCAGLDGERYETCGQRATHRLVGIEDCEHEGCAWTYGHAGDHVDRKEFPEALDGKVGPRSIAEARKLYEPRLLVCNDCLSHHHDLVARRERRAMVSRELLTHRPVEVSVGDRVIFSKWAGAHPTIIMGEALIVTDDVLGVVTDPSTPLIIRRESV